MSLKIISALFSEEGEGLPSYTTAFKDGDGKDADGLSAVFPIIRINDKELKPIGTGFFISNNGMFVTAKHVMEKNGIAEKDLAGVEMRKSENRIIIREVIKFTSHPTADLSVGMLRTEGNHTNKLFSLTKEFPKVGEKIRTWSFPQPKEFEISEKESDYKFPFRDGRGIITNHFPQGRDRHILPFNCFESQMEIKGGSSGGPVASMAGSVFGINSTGIEGTNISYITSIYALFDLKLSNVLLPDEVEAREVNIQEIIERKLIILK